MSEDTDKIQSFNPLLILVWILELIILAMDYSQDNAVSWSIPVIGSFLLIQVYMIWKTNSDELELERREAVAKSSSNLVKNTPLIHPGKTNLTQLHSKHSSMVDLTLSPSVDDDE